MPANAPGASLSIVVRVALGAFALAIVCRAQEPVLCAPEGRTEFVCGIDGPEDLVVVPGDEWVLASAYAGRGGIHVIRVADRATILAYPRQAAAHRFDRQTFDDRCPGPPDTTSNSKFQIHGLSLLEGTNSIHRLLAVMHGSRESVEVFDVDARSGTPTLTWVGCVVAPDPLGLNSVKALRNGGLVATNFLARPGFGGVPIEAVMKGEPNGELWEWQPASGWQEVPGTEAAGANGVQLSGDERHIYAAAWGSQSLFRVSRDTGPPDRRDVPLGFRADNVRWARDGSLLVAGQRDSPAESVVVKIDPHTLTSREIVRRADTPAFGAATVAVEVGQELWLGSFRGDRIAILPLPR